MGLMKPIPTALQHPDLHIPLRPVQLTDSESLATDCWPSRPYTTVYNLVMRAVRYAAEGRGLGVVAVTPTGGICGFGQVVMWPTCAEISDMVVTQAYRNQGIGTAIIQTLAQVAIQMGAEELEIGAALDNPRAATLYRRLGFADSHTVMLNMGTGKEKVLFLRLSLHEVNPAVVELD